MYAPEAGADRHRIAAARTIAKPGRIFFVGLLPKTHSGKLLRRAIQTLAPKDATRANCQTSRMCQCLGQISKPAASATTVSPV